jgi:hypothetical protein
LRLSLTGGAWPSRLSPTSSPGQPRPPFAAPAVTGRLPRAPRLQAPHLSCNEAPPSLPPLQSTVTPLNPPLPLIPHQGRGH